MIVATVLTALLLLSATGADSSSDDGDKIVGGYETTIEKFPYQISMQKNGRHSCGGSIMSQNWILTAAHCVRSVTNPATVTVRVGSSSRGKDGVVHNVTEVIYYPKYDSSTTDYDIALLKLKEPIQYNDQARAVTLTKANEEAKQGQNVIVSGWGTLSSGGGTPTILNAVRVPMLSRAACLLSYPGRITDRMICAGVVGKDSCQGDSGGPLVNAERVQVGVVSWGRGCAFAGYAGVYANVAHQEMREWIREKTGI